MADQIEDQEEWIRKERVSRKAFIHAFTAEPDVLVEILNNLGYYSGDPAIIKPELIAHANWLLGKIGILHIGNLEDVTRALIKQANEDDLNRLAERASKAKGGL